MSYDSVMDFMLDYNRNVHTIKPAVVTAVNNATNTLSAKILTKTLFKDGESVEFVDVTDVPFLILSGTKGISRVTIPVSVGDNVVILFSDRDVGGLMSSSGATPQEPSELKTHTFEPILALPCFFTQANAKPVDPLNIVIENGTSSVKVGSTGLVEIIAPTGMSITTPALQVNCPATVFTGTIATTGILPAPSVSNVQMTGDLYHIGSYVLNGVAMETHTHVEQGDGNPVGPPISP